jgi:hypothetical protein
MSEITKVLWPNHSAVVIVGGSAVPDHAASSRFPRPSRFGDLTLRASVIARWRHRREADLQDPLLSQGLVQLVSTGWRTLISGPESVPLKATADERPKTSTKPGFSDGSSSRAHPLRAREHGGGVRRRR